MSIDFNITTAGTAITKFWTGRTATREKLLQLLTTHDQRATKDGPCFVPGTLNGQQRKADAVVEISLLVYDIDGTQTIEEAADLLNKAGVTAVLYSSHNHATSQSLIKANAVESWTKRQVVEFPPKSREVMARYCRENHKAHLVDDNFEFDLVENQANNATGASYIVRHRPLDKFRVGIPLETPITISDLADSSKDAITAYKAIYHGVGRSLGLDYDSACEDPSRLYYLPSCRVGAARVALAFPNADAFLTAPLLDWKDEQRFPRIADHKTSETQHESGSGPTLVYEGVNLKTWAAQYAKTFDIEEVLRQRGLVKGDRSNAGVFIECHEGGHSGGEQETFAKSGNGKTGFVIYCSGHTGGCHKKDRLEHILDYLKSRLISVDDLKNPEYGGGEISNRAAREKAKQEGSRKRTTRVIDAKGVGFDTNVFIEKKLKSLNFDALRQRLNGFLPFGPAVTADGLAKHIQAGNVTVDDLIENCKTTEQLTGYRAALRELAEKVGNGILAAELDKEIASVGQAHGTNKANIKADLETEIKKIEEERTAFGILPPDETAKLKSSRNYSEQFAIINTGGKGVVLNTYEPDLSKAIMSHDDFCKLYRDDWVEIETKKGPIVIYIAAEWLKTPPHDAQFYRGGLVFKPTTLTSRQSVGFEQYNLYSGFLIEPDSSGSCSLFHDLLHEVWVQGNRELFEWVLEWFMHPLRYPGDKVRTAIAIRGEHGDGKSIVTEKLMAPIYGDMLVRVANDRMVLGDFNEILAGKLMIALEEAAFAGNKSAFARMKELVTGDTMLINPKHKAPITLDNYARMVVTSNQKHFLDIEPGDRRYTVLNSSPVWKGTKKFEALLDQWNNGGAARFVYEAMNHKFRTLDDGKQIVINTKIKTEHETGQEAESRGPLEKFFVTFLLRGNFSGALGGAHLKHAVLSCGGSEVWSFDEELELTSVALEDAVSEWYENRAPSKAAHIPGLRIIVATMESYYGNSPANRDASGERGKRGPTYRLLPKRLDALLHAYRQGRITRDEFMTAIDGEVAIPKNTAYAVLAGPASEYERGLGDTMTPSDPSNLVLK